MEELNETTWPGLSNALQSGARPPSIFVELVGIVLDCDDAQKPSTI
jgi:hypothetical protein